MPSIVTHHLFARDCLKGFESLVDKDIYYVFAQSFDNLFYYHFFTSLKNEVKKVGGIAQRTKTNDYFLNILNYIKEHNLRNDKEVIGYLFGSICHYALDSTCHPFVIYQSGTTDADYKYRGGHEKMEVMIDAIMYEKKIGKPLYKENLADTLLPKKKFKKDLEKTIDYAFKKTFGIDNMGLLYQESYHTGNFILKYFVTDKLGIKKPIYKIKDLFGKGRMYQYLSFHIVKLDKSFLNLEKEEWCYPTLKEKKKKSSFLELYDEAMNFAIQLFKGCLKYLNNEIKEDKLKILFKDLSYVTGLDWHLENKMQYFKY